MSLETPNELLPRLIEAGFGKSKFAFIGCTEQEIQSLEEQFSVTLPSVYKDFLRAFGKESGGLLNDCSYLYPSLTSIVRRDVESIQKRFGLKLEPSWFVFLSRDPIILLFDTAIGNDPPVWRFDEDREELKEVFPSFTAWLNEIVHGDIEGKKRLNANRA
jgi:hypothetical protein